jgi:hypothetical protein
LLDWLSGALRISVVVILPVHFKVFLNSDACGGQEADLLGFIFLKSGSAPKRVKVIFG